MPLTMADRDPPTKQRRWQRRDDHTISADPTVLSYLLDRCYIPTVFSFDRRPMLTVSRLPMSWPTSPVAVE